MSMDMGNPGVPGFGGYGNQGNSGETSRASRADYGQTEQQNSVSSGETQTSTAGSDTPIQALHENGSATAPGSNGAQPSPQASGSTAAEGHVEAVAADTDSHQTDHAEVIAEPSRGSAQDETPGFEASASACFKRAGEIADKLNHKDVSSDHLMLALTIDPASRRLIERLGDSAKIQQTAMERLGRNYTRSDLDDRPSKPTSDLADIVRRARDSAAEREQRVSISDIVHAFPKSNGSLAYAVDEGSRTEEVLDRIENGLVPRFLDTAAKIETAATEAVNRQEQSVQGILRSLSHSSQEWEQR